MSVTSGWGRLTWDQSQWGGATVLKTGWGAKSWNDGEWGTLVNETITLTGLSTTTSVGDLEAFNETGWGRLTWGTADWDEAADETVAVTGVESTFAIGSVNTEVVYTLEMVANPPTGDQLLKFARTSVGSLTVVTEEIAVVTGVSASFSTPTLSYVGTLVGWGRDAWGDNSWGESPNQVLSVVGLDATTSVGSISPADAVGLSGQEATTNVGSVTFTIDSTPAITGQEASGNVGH